MVGVAHYAFHFDVWRDDVCYLQDLFVDEAARGQGVTCYYWQKEDNRRARGLYDRLAEFRGFIRYDYPLD